MSKWLNSLIFHTFIFFLVLMLPLIDPLKDFISKDLNDQTVNTYIEIDGQRLKSEKDKNSKAFFFIKTL